MFCWLIIEHKEWPFERTSFIIKDGYKIDVIIFKSKPLLVKPYLYSGIINNKIYFSNTPIIGEFVSFSKQKYFDELTNYIQLDYKRKPLLIKKFNDFMPKYFKDYKIIQFYIKNRMENTIDRFFDQVKIVYKEDKFNDLMKVLKYADDRLKIITTIELLHLVNPKNFLKLYNQLNIKNNELNHYLLLKLGNHSLSKQKSFFLMASSTLLSGLYLDYRNYLIENAYKLCDFYNKNKQNNVFICNLNKIYKINIFKENLNNYYTNWLKSNVNCVGILANNKFIPSFKNNLFYLNEKEVFIEKVYFTDYFIKVNFKFFKLENKLKLIENKQNLFIFNKVNFIVENKHLKEIKENTIEIYSENNYLILNVMLEENIYEVIKIFT